MRILLIEHDVSEQQRLCTDLKNDGYEVDVCQSGNKGYFFASQTPLDIIIMDWQLPDVQGIELIKNLRHMNNGIPIILISAKKDSEELITGLDAGADDFIGLKCPKDEFLARVRAISRRQLHLTTEQTIEFLALTLNPSQQKIWIEEKEVELTRKEWELLEFLIVNKNRVLTREQVFDRVWGFESETVENVVELYIHYLRKKLIPFGYDQYIETVRGIGYMLKEPEESHPIKTVTK